MNNLAELSQFHRYMSPIEEIITEAKSGRMFILIDDEGRENEGDLDHPGRKGQPGGDQFHGQARPRVDLPGADPRARQSQLGLPLMTPHNASRHETAFTVVDRGARGHHHRHFGGRPGAHHRVAIDPERARRIVSPGHIFPLMARDGGVLVRTGHTEAAVDMARLAGLNPSGVICEIMNDDGTMARTPELVAFAQLHGLKIGTIADLIAYRRRHEQIVERRSRPTSICLGRRRGGSRSTSTRCRLCRAHRVGERRCRGRRRRSPCASMPLNISTTRSAIAGAASCGLLSTAMEMIAGEGTGCRAADARAARRPASPNGSRPARRPRRGRRRCATTASARRSCSISASRNDPAVELPGADRRDRGLWSEDRRACVRSRCQRSDA